MIFSDSILGRGAGSWWRFLGVGTLALVTYTLSLTVLGLLAGSFVSLGWIDYSTWHDFLQGGQETIGSFLLLFSSVAVLHPFVAFALWLFYRRPYLSLINPLHFPPRMQIAYGFVIIVGAVLLSEIVMIFIPNWETSTALIWQPKIWFLWLIPSIIIVFLQITAEEMFFRGYMQQYLARLTRRRFLYYTIPAASWALLHLGNFEEPIIAWGFVLATFIMGLIFADWADQSGSLAGPIAAHFANNFIATCIIGNSMESDVMDIWETDLSGVSDTLVLVYTMITIIIMALIYIWLRPRIRVQSPAA